MMRHLLAWNLVAALAAQAPVGFGGEQHFVTRYCFDCHGGDTTKARLDLGVDPGDGVSRLDRLRRVRARTRVGEMPPADAEQPSPAERAAFVAFADAELEREVPLLPPSPGRITIRRLNASQWQRTVRDLFGVEIAVDGFPADDLGYGFDTVGDALSFSALHLERYVAAAGAVAAEVFDGEDPAHPAVRRFEAEAMQVEGSAVVISGDVASLLSRSRLVQQVALPRPGRYRLRLLVRGDQGGDEPPRMVVSWDDAELAAVDVPERRMREFELALDADGGAHSLGIAFVNDYYEPEHPDARRRDRNLHVDWCEVVGPLDPRVVPPARRWLVDVAGDPALATADDAAKLRAIAEALLPRVFRRPVTAAEIARHVGVGERALASGDTLTEAQRLLLQSALSSPCFLFRGEADIAGAVGDVAAVPSTALASRLSYFVWASTPDDALLAAGRDGSLERPEVLLATARRLLEDERSAALATEFASQWLQLADLADLMPDPTRFPGFDGQLRAALRTETELLFLAVLRERRDVRELIDCDFTHLDARLADFYGIPLPPDVPVDAGFVRVSLPPELRSRGGVLGHASVLAVTSNPNRTSPVKRGKWILANLLDAPPPPPPPGNGALPDEAAAVDSTRSFREQLAQHRESPKCAVCHVRMDALGLALERYDAIGRHRTRDERGEIDCSGALPDGRRIDGLDGLKRVIRDDPAFLNVIAGKLFVYGIGREPRPVDRLRLEHEVDRLRRAGKVTIGDLVLAIVASDAFRRCEGG